MLQLVDVHTGYGRSEVLRFAAGNFDGEMGRYESFASDPVVDETSGERPLRIPRLRPRLRLLATAEPPPGRFVSMRERQRPLGCNRVQ